MNEYAIPTRVLVDTHTFRGLRGENAMRTTNSTRGKTLQTLALPISQMRKNSYIQGAYHIVREPLNFVCPRV